MKDKKIAVNKKFYYAVLTGCLMVIIGISAIVYNVSMPKNALSENGQITQKITSQSKTTVKDKNEAANYTPTGIPKPTTSVTTTVSDDEKPYTGIFREPVSGKVIKDYSDGEMVKNETMGDWRVHNGADFSAEEGENVFAVQNCVVSKIDNDDLWGICVTVTCPGNLTVKYCGLKDSVKYKAGDKIAKGGIIGKAGNIPAESALEPHIHIETMVDGKYVSPLKVMNML